MNAKKLPSGSWRARTYDAETKTRHSFTASTKKEAEFLANEWLTGRKKTPIEEKTVKQAISDYIGLKRDILSPTTLNGYDSLLKKQYSADFLALPIGSINNVNVQAEINRMSALFSPKTVHNANGLLSAALKMYFPDLRITVTLPKIQKRVRTLPDPESVIRIFRGTDIELPVLLAVWLGLRMGEILGLRKSDFCDNRITVQRTVSRIAGGVIVEKDTAKTVESRRPLNVPDPIMELVAALPGEKITDLNGDKIYHHFVKRMTAAGFPGVTFHDLRHVNASVMLALGIPDKYAMERGGWSTTSTLKRVYQETFSDQRVQADQKIDRYFGRIYKKLDTKLATTEEHTA